MKLLITLIVLLTIAAAMPQHFAADLLDENNKPFEIPKPSKVKPDPRVCGPDGTKNLGHGIRVKC